MNNSFLIALNNSDASWSTQVAVIMIISNIFAVGVGRYAIQVRNIGPSIPIAGLEGFGLTELLATTSLGHVIGAGAILGLRSTGIIS
jgi:photosystem I subunit 10|uniref:Photosystem I reaction center subunit PsaK n=2 Tax=Palmaria TaxID=2821 RepID=A0A6C0W2H9_PALDE|nr:photosystem I reaction center subunit PsaK [Palmaria decipiens]QIC19620.1 photosystem I reaction center subunit PsaK [Palmaria decipiens]BBI37320.1 Photosystem I reaction center subunit PsaK [Palmaria palmata]